MVDGPVQGFALSGSTFATSPSAATTVITNSDPSSTGLRGMAFPGGTTAGSYNSVTGTGGIVWATTATAVVGYGNDNSFINVKPGTLRAFGASDLVEIYNSDTAGGGRDTLGSYAKFSVRVVANGRVYVPTWDNSVAVYGLLPQKSVLAHP